METERGQVLAKELRHIHSVTKQNIGKKQKK